MLLLIAGLLAACSPVEPPQPEPQDEIRLDATVWQMMQGAPSRRVSTYESTPLRASTYNGGTLTSGSFTAAAYVENTTTPYINPVQVNWETDKWVWSDGKHYWPASGSLDFFAYMPATKPGYISSITYAVSGAPAAPQPSFVCADLPMTNSEQGSTLKEFVYAMALGQDKEHQGASGVTLTFKHPFARVKLQLAASQPKDVTIKTITLKSIQNNGSFTFDYSEGSSTWALSGDATNFVATLNTTYEATGVVQAIDAPYIMIPQTWAGEIEVVASWKEWGESIEDEVLSATVPTTWQLGYSYTYSFTISDYDLIVNIEKFTEQW